jgi:hypothetical protein
MVIVPVLDPLDVGANVTLMVQFAPAATPVPQVLLWENSLLFVLVNETLVMLKGAVPALPRITLCVVLVPKVWFPKTRLGLVVRVKPGAVFGLILVTNAP